MSAVGGAMDALGGAFGVELQLGLWAALLLGALYLNRIRTVVGLVSRTASTLAVVLVVLGLGLLTGVIPTINVGRLLELGSSVGKELADAVRAVISTGGGL